MLSEASPQHKPGQQHVLPTSQDHCTLNKSTSRGHVPHQPPRWAPSCLRPPPTARSVLGRLDLLGKLTRHESKALVLWLQSLTEISANGSVTTNFIMLLDGRRAGPSPVFLTGHQSGGGDGEGARRP